MANEQVRLVPREIREAFPPARFLSDEEQARYDEACKRFTGKAAESLRVGKKGSNLWKILLLNQIGIRTGTIQEIELAYENRLPLEDFYADGREVVLRSAGDTHKPNDYLARGLAEILGIRKFDNPFVIRGLTVKQDDNSHYGLSFEKTDKTQVSEAPDLCHKNHQRKFSRINFDYSLAFDDNGAGTLWTKDDGISRLYLNGDSDLGSRGVRLAVSGGYGRVVVVDSGEASAKNFDEYIAQLNSERERQEAELKKRYDNAIRVLKGN